MAKKKNKKKTFDIMAYVKANRSGEWEAKNENETGFVSKHSVHKSKKNYSRKQKHKERY